MRSLYSDVEDVTDFEHLLNGVELDAVVVATPVKHHFALAKASLLAGRHTFIEKPMASSALTGPLTVDLGYRLPFNSAHLWPLKSLHEQMIVAFPSGAGIGQGR